MSLAFWPSDQSQRVSQDALEVAGALLRDLDMKRPTVEALAAELGWPETQVVASLASLSEVGLRGAADLLSTTGEIPMRMFTFVGAYSPVRWHHA